MNAAQGIKADLTANYPDTYEMAELALRSGLVPLVKGSPGIGKSSLGQQFADEHNLLMVDIRLPTMDPTELNGFAFPGENGKATYLPMDLFPLKGEPVPKGYKGWLLFFDELTSADRSVQKAAYKILLDKMVGDKALHPKVAMMAAGNLLTDNAIVEEMSTALQSRVIHINMASDSETWLQWASSNEIDHRITTFIKWKPASLNNFDPDKSDTVDAYACERTWAFASRLLKNLDPNNPIAKRLLSGTIGEGAAHEFIAYLRLFGDKDMPTVEEILRDPVSAPLPSNPGKLFAITGSIAQQVTEDNLAILLEYIERMPLEFQVVCLQETHRRNPDITRTPEGTKWITKHNRDLT